MKIGRGEVRGCAPGMSAAEKRVDLDANRQILESILSGKTKPNRTLRRFIKKVKRERGIEK